MRTRHRATLADYLPRMRGYRLVPHLRSRAIGNLLSPGDEGEGITRKLICVM